MFQNSVLSVLHSDPASHTDTTRWGENAQVEETTTDSDQVEDTINEEESDDKEEEVDENNNGESKAFEHIAKTMNHLPDNHYVWGYPDPTNTYYNADKVATEDDEKGQRVDFIHWYDSQLHTMAEFKAIQMIMGYHDEFTAEMEGDEHESQTPLRDEAGLANGAEHGKQEDALTQKDAVIEQHPSTPLPIIEPLPYSSDSELTGVPMTASMTPNEEQGSSSVEPGWGRIESSKEKERMEDLNLWESINIGGYTNQRTTKAYRHGRCYMCSKPVSTTDLDPEVELFCKECD